MAIAKDDIELTQNKNSENNALKKTTSINLPNYPSDHRRYKFLQLDNGLKILLIENNKAQRALAVLDVATGSYYEPEKYPGLAHFLEHMIFV